MIIKIVEKDDEVYNIQDLMDDLKKSRSVDECGAIFSFEGFVRGKEDDMDVSKLILTVADKEKAEQEIKDIVESVKIKYGVVEINVVHYIGEFYTGDSLFLISVLGNHRQETLDAIKEAIERVKFEIEFKKEEISNKGNKIIMAGG
ncbi:MAG: molybdenum cofactor biosynthesis protein MoaE [archaeon]|nr:molybdenum cofactor biosynthesis protein MoaE [archaeon]